MSRPDDDERRTERAWREIVDNYGDRPDVGEVEPAAPPSPSPSPAAEEPPPDPPPPADPFASLAREERFVPPSPPPVPHPGWRRGAAWAGLVLAPALVLVLLVVQVDLPGLLDYLFVGWFVAGFVYLVATMRDEPRDPGDDGSRV